MNNLESNPQTIKKWKIGASTFTAWPERGARLMSWKVRLADGTSRDVIYWPEGADLEHPAKVRGGNPILFPFVARSFHKDKENMWKTPAGDVIPMPRHGFARDGRFEIITSDEKSFTVKLCPTEEDRKVYPYEYEFRVKYTFSELSLKVDFELENKDGDPIPWSAGHHFYFAIPWHKGLSRSDYAINIPSKKAFYHQSDGKLVKTQDLEFPASLDNEILMDRIHTKLKSNKVTFGPKGGDEDMSITIGTDPLPPAWTCMTTWTEDREKSPFFCVEPWMGPPSAPEHGNGLHFVNPGEVGLFSVEVSLF